MSLDDWIEGRGGPHFTLPNAPCNSCPSCDEALAIAFKQCIPGCKCDCHEEESADGR